MRTIIPERVLVTLGDIGIDEDKPYRTGLVLPAGDRHGES